MNATLKRSFSTFGLVLIVIFGNTALGADRWPAEPPSEPPADWGVTKGEDTCFAHRMAEGIGIKVPKLPKEDQYYLQGLEPDDPKYQVWEARQVSKQLD